MAKLERKLQKIFGETAGTDGKTTFGSIAQTGQAVFSEDVEQLQTDAYSTGWRDAIKIVEGKGKAPILTDFNTVNYISSYQIKYLQQMGIAEWLATETYYIGSRVCYIDNGVIREFVSLIDDNININPISDDGSNWQDLKNKQWNINVNYGSNEIVIRYNNFYRSRINNNKGNDPYTDRTNWAVMDRQLPIYNSSKNYSLNDKICYIKNNVYYEFRSLKDDNIGNTPQLGVLADANWQRIHPDYTQYWEATQTYAAGEKIYYTINNTYYEYVSNIDNNVGHTPPDSQGDTYWYRTVAPQTQFSLFTNVVDLGSATSYTAPADGYFFFHVAGRGWSNNGNGIEVYVNGIQAMQFRLRVDTSTAGYVGGNWAQGLYVKKGAVITVTQNMTEGYSCYFAYTN